jgi:gamma-glutamyltranspeptidase / glutathione hydrolase
VTRRIRSVLAIVLGIVLVLPATVGLAPTAAQVTKQPTAVGTGGAAATVDVLASQAAIDILGKGGNAIDAAVAAAAVLGVTEPFSCGIGGGGFMVVYRASDHSVTTIDHRETAPSAMRPDSFWEGGAPLSFPEARWSGLSAGVPGTVRGWDEALARFGTMSFRETLRPAIGVAREGFEVDQVFHDQVAAVVDFFDDVSSTEETYLDPDGTAPDVGSTFRNPDMARAYKRIAHLGPKGFYKGAIAAAMVNAVRKPPLTPDANHEWRPGDMTMRDVMGYRAPLREPTAVSYRGLDVFGMGPHAELIGGPCCSSWSGQSGRGALPWPDSSDYLVVVRTTRGIEDVVELLHRG